MMNTSLLRVLLVDDDQEDRQLVRWALTSAIHPITIEEMNSGQDLIDWLAKQPRLGADQLGCMPDWVTVILLDMHMPQRTGLQTLQGLGDLSQLSYMPVIMLTSVLDEPLKQNAYQQGIHLFMSKPSGRSGYYRVVEAVKLCYRDVLRRREHH